MYLVGLLILAGVAVYAVSSTTSETVSATPTRLRERVGIRDRRVVVETDAGRLLHYYDLSELDYFALRARGRGKPYELLFDFSGEQLRLNEDEPGVEALLGELVELAPALATGMDFSRFGEALEARDQETFVFLDRRTRRT